jgi:hypothetical protein
MTVVKGGVGLNSSRKSSGLHHPRWTHHPCGHLCWLRAVVHQKWCDVRCNERWGGGGDNRRACIQT